MHQKLIRCYYACVLWIFGTITLSASAAAPQVTDILGNLSASDFSTYIAPQTYRDWGNEPCIAVNPLDPRQIVVSSFGYGSWVSSQTAQLWYSTNAGVSWNIRFAVPDPITNSTSTPFFVDDQSSAYDSSGVLHCGMMGIDKNGTDHVFHGTTTNINSAGAWTWTTGQLGSTSSPDQPWIALGGGRVAVAYDDFAALNGVEQRVSLSTNNGATFPPGLDLPVGSPGGAPNSSGGLPPNFINPGLRVTMDNLGDAFVIFGMATNGTAGVPLMNYRLNRYSGGPGWDFTSATADGIGGISITNGLSRQGTTNIFWFGNGLNALLGNITAIAVNTNGSRIYVVYGLSGASGIGRLFLQRFQPSGTNLVAGGAALALSSTNFSAALPAVAVAENGTVAIMYHEYDGTNFLIHLALSSDLGQSIRTNLTLYSFRTNGMVFSYGTSNHDRLLGDYDYLRAQSNVFYAAFPARGNTAAGGIVTTNFIDPFFFSMSAFQQPILSQPMRTGGQFQLTLTGETNVTYIVQSSTNLQTWTPVLTNTAATSIRLLSISATNSQSYYRAVVSQ